MDKWKSSLESMAVDMSANAEFWRGKSVLVTGHTGFKGSWLALWLSKMGADVSGVSLPPQSVPSLFELGALSERVKSHFCDIRDFKGVRELVEASRPEVVFHLAAQPLVRAGYRDPLGTFETNVSGTANVLESVKGIESVRVVVAITTDKVYRNQEHWFPYRETDELGGYDPYSASKAAAEHVISCYRDSFLRAQNVAVASARAGNVIGGGDWSEDRLIPDAVRAWSRGEALRIRRPQAVRPWQHVLEPLRGYLMLAEHLYANADLQGAFNFGPLNGGAATVETVINLAKGAYGRGEVIYDREDVGPHEAGLLTLEIAKSQSVLGFRPKWGLEESIERTMRWYASHLDGADVVSLCDADITGYCNRG